MTAGFSSTARDISEGSALRRIRATAGHRHILVPRLIAGVPLLGIGAVHVLDPQLRMGPLVEAASIPFATAIAPLGVAFEIVAGLSLLLGLWSRIGGLIAAATMAVAAYAHLAIDVWPNGAENEPPMALPIVVGMAAAYVVWRGAGRWSLDRQASAAASSA
ncbi:MAG: DoxX family membrane protein [Dehalococcoidia bacterium]